MSKGLKKVAKVAAKFDLGHQAAKSFGLPDPVGDTLYGKDRALSPAERADALAKTQNKFAQEQANKATAEAQQQALASTQALQLQTDRQRVNAQVADMQQPIDQTEVQVDTSAATDEATRRKRFNSTSANVGTGGATGPAIRI